MKICLPILFHKVHIFNLIKDCHKTKLKTPILLLNLNSFFCLVLKFLRYILFNLLWRVILEIELRALDTLEVLFHWARPSAFSVHFGELTTVCVLTECFLFLWRIWWDIMLLSGGCVCSKGAKDPEDFTYKVTSWLTVSSSVTNTSHL